MERRVSLAAVLLLVVASQVLVLQPPPLVSAAKPPKTGSGGGSYSFSGSGGGTKKALKILKGFLKLTPYVGDAINLADFVWQETKGDNKSDQPDPSSPPANSPPAPPASPSTGNSSDAAQTSGLFYISLDVGSPVQTLTGVVDISTQYSWMFCDQSCSVCAKSPSFKRFASTTAFLLLCDKVDCQNIFPGRTCAANEYCTYYTRTPTGSVASYGYYVSDTLTSGGNTVLPSLVFGCTDPNPMDTSGVSGVVGFGRGPQSLVSQLGITNFSYNLGQDGSTNLLLGNVIVPPNDGKSYRVRSARILQSRMFPDLYYVDLTGIKVGGEDLAGIPAGSFDLRSDGTGGVSLSTTVPITYLVEEAYNALKKAFMGKISAQPVDTRNLDGRLDLCYAAEALDGANKVPSLALVFGKGSVVDLDVSNYLFKLNDGTRDLMCLTVLPSRGWSMLGSLMQTGRQMVFDLQAQDLTFVTEEEEVAAGPSALSLAAPRSQAAWLLAAVAPIVVWWSMRF